MSTSQRVRKAPHERVAEIAHAAREIALADGLNHVTIRAVAQRIGSAPGLVTHYVDGMNALRSDTFTRIVADELAQVRSTVDSAATSVDAMRALVSGLFAGDADPITGVWLDGWSIGRHDDVMARAVRVQMDAWQDFLVDLLTRGRDNGSFYFDPADVDSIAWHIVGTIDGLNAHSLVGFRRAADRSRLLARSMELELGLRPGTLRTPIPTGTRHSH